MRDDASSADELRDVAARVIAATAYFKSAGHLPDWARAELEEREDREAPAAERRSPTRTGPRLRRS